MSVDVPAISIPLESTIHDALAAIDRSGIGIALVVEEDGRLIGTVTDGDIRRAMLAHVDPTVGVQALLDRQKEESLPRPLTAPAEATPEQLLVLMNEYQARQIPIVDEHRHVLDVAVLTDLVKDYRLPLRAVIMAGGFGSRLGDLTSDLPKPMLPVGEQPLLERIIDQLRVAGIRRATLTTHYRADAITQHFGTGAEFGVDIRYVTEDEPLGTAGALGLLDESNEPILVMNGDIVTEIDFHAMLAFHQAHDAELTMAVWPYEIRVPYGMVEAEAGRVSALTEKPLVRGFVNAGIYLLKPEVQQLVPRGRKLDMPDLIDLLIADGRTVMSFPIREYWIDIGTRDDYERATAVSVVENTWGPR
jgi:dTDP-glucose pyrophosphorylase/CBS domain-containing protein